MVRTPLWPAVSLVVVLTGVGTAEAQKTQQRDAGKEAAIRAELQSVAPTAVADFDAATAALDAGRLAEAVDGFGRVLAAAPEFDPAMRRRGGALVNLGRRAEGLPLLERAVGIRRSAANVFTLAHGLWNRREGEAPPPRNELVRAKDLAREAAGLDPDDADAPSLWAQASLEVDDLESFRAAVAALQARHSDRMTTHYYAAVRAALDQKWTLAEDEIREAGRLGLGEDAVKGFLATGIGTRAKAWRWAKYVGVATAVWAAGLVLLFLTGNWLSAATLHQVERDDPNAEVTPGTLRLRSIYRWVVTTAGLYWYLSLPFVAVLVIALTASVFYAFLLIGRIPVKLAAIIGIGALVTIYALIRSLFVRIVDEDPGRAVSESDAPGLWRMAREVASEVGTRPVDEIWLTTGTELAVFERGGLRARMRDTARRALMVGAGVLEGFDGNALRAVLAHEYGHFSHRDTAGGDVALRVRNGMFKFAYALAQAGYAVWWNLGFQFLRLYDVLFRRISHGATRLQEVLADRVAIRRYGLNAFRAGLTHAIRRSVEFDMLADGELNAAIAGKRAVANLYALRPENNPDAKADIDKAVQAALEAPTTADDTHPSPRDRFRLGERIRSASMASAGGAAWDLFRDAGALKAELHDVILDRIAATHDVVKSLPRSG